MKIVHPIQWCDEGKEVWMLDQTKLPAVEIWVRCRTAEEVAEAIRTMKIRGAPAIGVAAAMGMALTAVRSQAASTQELLQELEASKRVLAASRPTAVNLFWALERMTQVAQRSARAEFLQSKDKDVETERLKRLQEQLVKEALLIFQEDVEINRRIGKNGAVLIPQSANILTHCNTGSLATAGYGTALGVIRAAYEQGKNLHVWVDETRPFLQGSRLTAWELLQDGIPFTLITDNMAASLMKQQKVDVVIVGADRIAANGDVANKIGTYNLAVLCKHHGIPFYVAAPTSTIDLSIASGDEIPIEQRSPDEVTKFGGVPFAPEGIHVYNPAFDVTPHELVSAIVTEKGIHQPPYGENLKRTCSS